jgi:hypothetical protein
MAWRDKHLKAKVQSGQFSNPEAEMYLFETLKKRRDKIGRFWFSRVNPLDNFRAGYEAAGFVISFDDLGIKYRLWPDNAEYSFELDYMGRQLIANRKIEARTVILSQKDLKLMTSSFEYGDEKENHLYKIDIHTSREKSSLSKPTRLWLWYFPEDDRFDLIGIEHLG